MDWTLAIEKNRQALKGILAMLVSLVGIVDDAANTGARSATLPRHLHRFALRLLRPAEAATRRLIIVAARGLEVSLTSPRIANKQPQPALVENGLGQLVPAPQWPKPPRARVPVRPRGVTLPLFDPPPRRGARRYVKPHDVPRIRCFDDMRVPLFRQPPQPDPPPPTPEDPLDAGRLHRRIDAIGRALDDLPRHAKRLARWQARRDAGLSRKGETPEAANLSLVGEMSGRTEGGNVERCLSSLISVLPRRPDTNASGRCGPVARPDGGAGLPIRSMTF